MDFRVYTDNEGSFDNYTGESGYNIQDSGVLQVWSHDQDVQVFYGIGGWIRVQIDEAPAGPSVF